MWLASEGTLGAGGLLSTMTLGGSCGTSYPGSLPALPYLIKMSAWEQAVAQEPLRLAQETGGKMGVAVRRGSVFHLLG